MKFLYYANCAKDCYELILETDEGIIIRSPLVRDKDNPVFMCFNIPKEQMIRLRDYLNKELK